MKFKVLTNFIKAKIRISRYRKTNNIQIPDSILGHVKLKLNGNNNNIIIESQKINGMINIKIHGDNNTVKIAEGFRLSKGLNILIGHNHPCFGKVNHSDFIISKGTSMESVSYTTFNSNSYCKIGENCMFAYNITLFNTDAHPIFDLNTKKIINFVRGIEIGNHCWIGANVSILKNSMVPDGSIIGWGSVYTGRKNSKPNCVYAGNPAKVVREGVDWERNGSKVGYIANSRERREREDLGKLQDLQHRNSGSIKYKVNS